MKNINKLMSIIILYVLMTNSSLAEVVVRADFNGSATTSLVDGEIPFNQDVTTTGNLNAGTIGGTWSQISSVGWPDESPPSTAAVYNDGARFNGSNFLVLGSKAVAGNGVWNDARLDFDEAVGIEGTTISISVSSLFSNGGVSYFSLMDNDSRAVTMGWEAFDGDIYYYYYQDGNPVEQALSLGHITDIWPTADTEVTFELSLAADSLSLTVGDTTIDSLNYRITPESISQIWLYNGEGENAWAYDDITVNTIPEASTTSLLALVASGTLFIRRRFLI